MLLEEVSLLSDDLLFDLAVRGFLAASTAFFLDVLTLA